MEDRIKKRVCRAIHENIFPGCVVGVVRRDGERIVLPFGKFRYEENALAIKDDSIFDVASITKAIPTALSALYCIEEGRLHAETRVIDLLPEVHNASRDDIRVRHLLTQTVGYGEEFRLSSLRDKSPEEILQAIFFAPLRYAPGEYFLYTNTASVLLGLLVERVAKETLSDFADKIFFKPLSMARTKFKPLDSFLKEEIVPTEVCKWRGGEVQGEVHDESAWKLQKFTLSGYVNFAVGSAGLFSTVPDLLTILEMLLSGGEYRGRRYFSEDAVAGMYQNHLYGIGESHGLGWELCNRRWMGDACGARTFGKTGFTGCSVMCDPDKGVGLVILSNYTYPKRKPDSSLINEFRRDVADIVFGE
ncbi:MAG: serine hydrolase domain-containing protein [Nanoarchaeota archaeon]|nr:serine hydrolase domain-containing protein [Nanoarchaeota archaeon]